MVLALSYKIDVHDEDTYELASDDKDYNEESENELIKPVDIEGFKFLRDDDSRYKPLHSYIKSYNDKQLRKPPIIDTISRPRIFESEFEPEERPYIAGFKSFLDKFYASEKSSAEKRESGKGEPRSAKNRVAKSDPNTQEKRAEDNDEGEYDYAKFKMEYYEQFAQDIEAVNDTDIRVVNETEKGEIKSVIDSVSRNCTQDTEGVNIETVKCFVNGIQNETYYSDKTKRKIRKIWLTFKIWFIIYTIVATILWCQRGWCCCCFRCKFCFPKRRLSYTKQYYVKNPPGVLLDRLTKGKSSNAIRYEPTELEEDAYEQLEAVIAKI